MVKCFKKINQYILSYHMIGKGAISYYNTRTKHLRVISTSGVILFEYRIELDEEEFVSFSRDTYEEMIKDNETYEFPTLILN